MFRANIKKKTSRKTVFFVFFFKIYVDCKKNFSLCRGKKNVFFAAYACSGKVSTEFKSL